MLSSVIITQPGSLQTFMHRCCKATLTYLLHLLLTSARIQVPYRLKKSFNKIQQRLVRELEKKFSGKDVVLIANRRIMPPQKGASNKRPRSRTLTSVRFSP